MPKTILGAAILAADELADHLEGGRAMIEHRRWPIELVDRRVDEPSL